MGKWKCRVRIKGRTATAAAATTACCVGRKEVGAGCDCSWFVRVCVYVYCVCRVMSVVLCCVLIGGESITRDVPPLLLLLEDAAALGGERPFLAMIGAACVPEFEC
jgi:hypothetical protein